MPGATYTLEPVTITGGTNHTGVTRLGGFSLRATTAGSVNLRAETATGQILATTDKSDTVLFDGYINAPAGVYVEVVAGAWVGVLYDME